MPFPIHKSEAQSLFMVQMLRRITILDMCLLIFDQSFEVNRKEESLWMVNVRQLSRPMTDCTCYVLIPVRYLPITSYTSSSFDYSIKSTRMKQSQGTKYTSMGCIPPYSPGKNCVSIYFPAPKN